MATEKSLDLARRLWGWQPHSDGQRQFLLSPAKVKIASCGRRWGKSEATGIDAVLFALERPNTTQWVLAPTTDQTRIIMGEVQRRLYAIPGFQGCFTERRAPHWEFVFHDGRGLREPTMIRSRTLGTTGRGLRGHKGHRAIVDERAFASDGIMQNVVTPLLADYDGDLVEISTPDGVGNGFHENWLRGQKGSATYNPRYESFWFPTSDNPYISAAYLANEQATKPELVFAQEYRAEFLDREGAVFRKIMLAATLEPIFQEDGLYIAREPVTGHQYVMGVDWARSKDFTVLTVFDITAREMVAMDRFNQIQFSVQRKRLEALHKKYNCISIVAEQNSIGLPNIEALQAEGMPVQPFLMTNATKAEVVDTLALALEQMDLSLINVAPVTSELMAYRGTKLPSGLIQYSAPEGKHDDVCVSLMLSVWGAGNCGVQTAPSLW